jgi:hypothetical protein
MGPGVRDDLMILQATFGLLVSDDGGGRFQFFCEDTWQFLDNFDPPVAVGAQSSLLVGIHNGLTRSRDGCAPTRDTDLDGLRVADLAYDATGRVVIAGVVSPGRPVSRLARSEDGGERFEVLPETFDNVAFSTVEVGSADATRIYASGLLGESRVAALWRSDDGGRTWTRSPATFDGDELFIAGVDRARPDVVWARLTTRDDAGLGATALLRSDDGAMTFREVARTRGPMRGFALRDDGRAVWIGGPSDGLLRSDDGGPFRAVSDTRVECLRWHAGSLWACGTYAPGAVLLWRARGDGALTPALRWDEVQGPPARCATGTPTRDVCPLRWSIVRSTIAPTARDAGLDAGTRPPVVTAPPSTGCGCRAGGHGGGGVGWARALAMGRRRRRRA